MKQLLLCAAVVAVFAACSGQSSQSSEGTTNTQSSQTTKQTGEQLISQSDCMSCHNIDATIIGPAYLEVAEKYESNEENIEMLSQKIIKGGAGNWGDIPMTPHPTVSEDDAKEMARYILSLKK